MSRRLHTWWHGLTDTAKFAFYSRVTLQAAAVGIAGSLAVSTPTASIWPGIALTGVAAILVTEVQPGLASPWGERVRRVVLPIAVVVFVGVLVAYAVVADLGTDDPPARGARIVAIFVALVAGLVVVPFARGRWWWTVAGGAAIGFAFGSTWSNRLLFAGLLIGVGAFCVGSMVLTIAALRIVADLERARTLEARLQVADERLRFARDLHDVVGRGFSAIAVKSELAASLARAGAADRAGAEMEQVKALAVESMEQMRHLVRGYREIDLSGEVAGARSLLAAIGCTLAVEGDPAALPGRFHEVAAWVTREGTTNIVRHTAATTATLAFGPTGMSLRNDGPVGPVRARSGLRGLAERVEAVGGTLHTVATDDTFTLEVVWGTR